MTPKQVIALRLFNHQILETSFTLPEEIISYYGAMQAQDWSMAKWALGLRLPHLKEKDVDDKLNDGSILRTHILRPTWHLVSPKDIRWMQQLTAHRVHQANKTPYKNTGLDPKVFLKTEKIIQKALEGKNYLTREELSTHFDKNIIKGDRMRLTYIVMNSELQGLICSGPRIGKQFTYALMEERVPQAKSYSKDEALKKLTSIYFNSRSPATVKDYSWWSGLTLAEARAGVEMLNVELLNVVIEGETYFFKAGPVPEIKGKQSTFLIPDYDEYGISYKDRSFYHHPKWKDTETMTNADYFHAIAVDGYFGGTWNKKISGKKMEVTVQPYLSLNKHQQNLVKAAVKKYHTFFSD